MVWACFCGTEEAKTQLIRSVNKEIHINHKKMFFEQDAFGRSDQTVDSIVLWSRHKVGSLSP